MFCHNCGTQLPDDSRFCFNCGAEQLVEEPAPQPVPAPTPSPEPAPAPVPAPAPGPEPVRTVPEEMGLQFPDFEPEAYRPKPGPAEPKAVPGPEPAQPVPAGGKLPTGTFTWEHVTISGEFTDGKGTITIHFE